MLETSPGKNGEAVETFGWEARLITVQGGGCWRAALCGNEEIALTESEVRQQNSKSETANNTASRA